MTSKKANKLLLFLCSLIALTQLNSCSSSLKIISWADELAAPIRDLQVVLMIPEYLVRTKKKMPKRLYEAFEKGSQTNISVETIIVQSPNADRNTSLEEDDNSINDAAAIKLENILSRNDLNYIMEVTVASITIKDGFYSALYNFEIHDLNTKKRVWSARPTIPSSHSLPDYMKLVEQLQEDNMIL